MSVKRYLLFGKLEYMSKTYKNSELIQSESTLNNILNIIVEGVWDWNANTGLVIRSPGWYAMLGYKVDAFNKGVFTWEKLFILTITPRLWHTLNLI